MNHTRIPLAPLRLSDYTRLVSPLSPRKPSSSSSSSAMSSASSSLLPSPFTSTSTPPIAKKTPLKTLYEASVTAGSSSKSRRMMDEEELDDDEEDEDGIVPTPPRKLLDMFLGGSSPSKPDGSDRNRTRSAPVHVGEQRTAGDRSPKRMSWGNNDLLGPKVDQKADEDFGPTWTFYQDPDDEGPLSASPLHDTTTVTDQDEIMSFTDENIKPPSPPPRPVSVLQIPTPDRPRSTSLLSRSPTTVPEQAEEPRLMNETVQPPSTPPSRPTELPESPPSFPHFVDHHDTGSNFFGDTGNTEFESRRPHVSLLPSFGNNLGETHGEKRTGAEDGEGHEEKRLKMSSD